MKELFKKMRAEFRDAAPRDSWQPDIIATLRAEGRELSGGKAQGKTGSRAGPTVHWFVEETHSSYQRSGAKAETAWQAASWLLSSPVSCCCSLMAGHAWEPAGTGDSIHREGQRLGLAASNRHSPSISCCNWWEIWKTPLRAIFMPTASVWGASYYLAPAGIWNA